MSYTKQIQAACQQRAEKITTARDILEKAETEKRGLTEDERGRWEALHGEIESDAARIKMLRDQQEAERSIESTPIEGATPIESREAPNSEQRNRIWRHVLRPQQHPLDDEGRSIAKRMGIPVNTREFDIRLSNMSELRALSIVTGGAGPELVPEGFVPRIETAMLAWGGMRQAGAEIFRTSGGGPLPIPTGDDTANVGAIIAESTAVTGDDGTGPDPTFAQMTLNAYKYETKAILVPYELIEDDAVDLESWLGTQLGTRVGRITNQHFTTGTGTGQPNGAVTFSTQGASGALTFDNLQTLIHSIDPAYRSQGARLMLNDTSLLTLKQLKDADNRYFWQPDVSSDVGDRILTYPYVINQDMADHAAAAKSVLFGAFGYYKIRDVGSMRMKVLTERWAEKDSVGFLGFSRHDGDGTISGTIKHLVGV